MTKTMRSCALLTIACALAACGGEKTGTSADSGSNKVLEGTISDDMIPYDTLRSQPPAAKIVTDATGSPSSGSTRGAPDSNATAAAEQGEGTDDEAGAAQANDAAGPSSDN